MDYILMVFTSVTGANKMKTALSKYYKIDSWVIQTPKYIGIQGCSYCLRVREEYLDIVKKASKEIGLTPKGIFKERKF